ncbi:lipopolysaccharide-induced tumor necrosis factor-alpha factor homolog [Amphiura filiformis]|uniref:lipopolysaccharide-induced tumor necrosis factor-alpha factor homolog n=1 Tax=Amphiura filiformis TaxID=82378 RepID=UPI003B22833B
MAYQKGQEANNPAYPPQQAPPPAYPGPPQQPYPTQTQPYPTQPYPTQPQGGYPPQGQAGPPPVVVQQPTTTTIVTTQVQTFGDNPAVTKCPNCQNTVTSVTGRECGGLVALVAVAICCVMWPCFWIAFLIPALYDVSHTCPVCKYRLGYHRKI